MSSSYVRVHFYGIVSGGQERGAPWKEDSEDARGQPFSATWDLFGQFSAADAESVVVRDSGPTANSGSVQCLGRRKSLLKQWGIPPSQTLPARARFKFGVGLLGGKRFAAEMPAGMAGVREKFAAFS